MEQDVRLQEELGQPELGVAPDVVADLVERAEEGPAIRALGVGGGEERPAANHLEPRGIPPGLLRGRPELLDERRDPVERHVAAAEAVAEGHRPPDGRRPVAPDGDRRVRDLDRPRPDVGARHPVELPPELDRVLRPDRLETGEELVGAPPAPVVGHSDRVVLVPRPAEAEPDVEAPARDLVERGELLGEHDRRVVGHDEDARAQSDARRHARHERERHHRIGHGLEAVRPRAPGHRRVVVLRRDGEEQALEYPERVVAETLGFLRDAHLVGGRGPRAGHGQREAELHRDAHAAHDTRSAAASERPREGIMSPVLAIREARH